MVDAWGLGNGESDVEEIDETTFMAIGDSDTEDDETSQVSIIDLKKISSIFES